MKKSQNVVQRAVKLMTEMAFHAQMILRLDMRFVNHNSFYMAEYPINGITAKRHYADVSNLCYIVDTLVLNWCPRLWYMCEIFKDAG